jgi:hypothetical protein
MDVYRTLLHRYDRAAQRLERAQPFIDSCMLDFGTVGDSDEDLFFHLSCDYPSTVAFAQFTGDRLDLLPLEDVPSRTSHARETCGSWYDPGDRTLYCVTGEGRVYRVRCLPPEKALLAHLPLAGPRCVPLHALHGGGGRLFVGVSTSSEERSLGLMSEVCPVSLATAAMGPFFKLPFPVLNFVVDPAGEVLVGVNPYLRALLVVATASGKLLDRFENLGCTPAEVQIVPAQ